jgi:hypothetical protein
MAEKVSSLKKKNGLIRAKNLRTFLYEVCNDSICILRLGNEVTLRMKEVLNYFLQDLQINLRIPS